MTKSSEWIRRVFLSATVTVLVAVVVAVLASCSVYKSNGRKGFEGAVGGNTTGNNVGQSTGEKPTADDAVAAKEKEEDTCWTQPAKEPLWDLPESTELRVHLISPELLEVCLVSQE